MLRSLLLEHLSTLYRERPECSSLTGDRELPKRFGCFQNLFRPRPHQVVLREVYPTNGAAGIQQKLPRPGDVLTIDSRSRMEQVIAANRLRLRIRKKWEGVARFLTQVARDFGTVYADSNRANSRDSTLIQTVLNTPQLGVARWSPVATIENHQHSLLNLSIDCC